MLVARIKSRPGSTTRPSQKSVLVLHDIWQRAEIDLEAVGFLRQSEQRWLQKSPASRQWPVIFPCGHQNAQLSQNINTFQGPFSRSLSGTPMGLTSMSNDHNASATP